MKNLRVLTLLCVLLLACTCACSKKEDSNSEVTAVDNQPTFTYMGHASTKIKTSKGTVIYIDPYYAKGDYSEAADIILITHDHSDHNNDWLCTKSDDCQLINAKTALVDDVYQQFTIDDVTIEAVPAGGNSNHKIGTGVGYILTFDDISLYQAGDTSYIEEMDSLAERKLDYALFPIDGIYNMDAVEATKVANIVGARYSIPIHEFDTDAAHKADNFTPDSALKLDYGETISLSSR